MKVEITNLGRNKHNHTGEFKDEKALHKYIGKFILSKMWGMEPTETENLWVITSGWNNVGYVKIISN